MYVWLDNIHTLHYDGNMNKEYHDKKNQIYFIRYQILFCPRYRRKIFLVDGVAERFEQLVNQKCKELDCTILDLNLGADYVYLFIDASTIHSSSEIVTQIKSYTSGLLRKEFGVFSKMPGLWTRNCMITTGIISEKDKEEFIRRQVKRY